MEEKKTTQVSEETICPSCGKFVGPVEVCPYCTADIKKRTSLMIYKWGSLIMAFVGIILLWYIVRHLEVPEVKISDINPTMNFGYVKIKGTVTRVWPYDIKKSYAKFNIDDGTSPDGIAVFAFKKTGRALMELGKMPSLGDHVEVCGKLSVKEEWISMSLDVPGKVIVTPLPVEAALIRKLTKDKLSKKVWTKGRVERMKKFSTISIITVSDPTNDEKTIQIPYYKTFGEVKIEEGDMVIVTGLVTQYRDNLQITPTRRGDLKVLESKEEEFEIIEEGKSFRKNRKIPKKKKEDEEEFEIIEEK